jgi:hypothetical protein
MNKLKRLKISMRLKMWMKKSKFKRKKPQNKRSIQMDYHCTKDEREDDDL